MVNKFDKPVQKDWSWKTAKLEVPTLSYEMLDSLAKEKQDEYNSIASLNALVPKAIQSNPDDLAKQQEYRKLVNEGTDVVTNAYMQSVGSGAMAYRDFKSKVQKAWQPGGIADVLNNRYNSYVAATKAIDDFYKDDTSPVNKTLAKQALLKMASAPTGYDPETGSYNQINTPELYKTVDINKKIDDMLHEIKENGTTQFLNDSNKDWWIQKIKTETREPERIKLAFQALSQQPEISSQIQRDAEYKAMTIDPTKHQAAFEESLKSNYDSLVKTAEDAKKDKESTKDWQNTLRQQGYNVKADGDFGELTKKATEEFLNSQKKTVDETISKYDFKNQMQNEATNSYLNYALRGAYKKVDGDLKFNEAKKTLGDWQLKSQENQINMWRAQQEFKPDDGASTTSVSGVAQNLGSIQTYYDASKDKLKQTEQQVSNALKNSRTFNGWTPENVAQAYNSWQNVKGNTDEEKKANYKAELAKVSDYPFTDKQIDQLYQEMNGAGPGEVKTALETLGAARSEVNRISEALNYVGDQYVNTPEGRNAVTNLRKSAPPTLRLLSDKELVNKALSNPEMFEIKVDTKNMEKEPGFHPGSGNKYNPAEVFSNTFKRDVASQEKKGKQYDWGSYGTIEVYANNDDKVLKPVMNGVAQALETGTGLNFASFGMAGLEIRNKDGDKLTDVKNRKVNNIGVAVDMQGNPILKVAMTVKGERGGEYLGYTDLQLVPGSVEHAQVLSGMKKAYVEQMQKNPRAAKGYLQIIDALEGVDAKNRTALNIENEKLNLNNTKPLDIYMKDPNGNIFNAKNLGYQVKDLQQTENINGYTYECFGVNTPTGNATINTFLDANGLRWISPSTTGELFYKNPDDALKDRKAKQILNATPIEVTETKVHTGGQGTTTETRSKSTTITKTTNQE